MVNSQKKLPQLYAGLGPRIVAFLLDYLIISLYLILLIGVTFLTNNLLNNGLSTLFANRFSSQVGGFLTVTLPVSLYFALTESSARQATWGKWQRGLQVVRLDGQPLTFGRALGRTLLKFVPWELAHTCVWQMSFANFEMSPAVGLGLILVWVLVGANVVRLWISPQNQTFYDWFTKTAVIKTPDIR